ncbi:hypothetical protein GQ54DRAFT_83111 [Martensiomyces pterosporus]|nr:hypothetical protein GQ54DRAFT_83111 [Martensiomyces pterosporus]
MHAVPVKGLLMWDPCRLLVLALLGRAEKLRGSPIYMHICCCCCCGIGEMARIGSEVRLYCSGKNLEDIYAVTSNTCFLQPAECTHY